jgi:CDP-glucose 4,6-dehydratase
MEDMGVTPDAAADWSGRTVFLTGAAGLLGRAVGAQLASEGASVLGFDNAWGHLHPRLRPDGIEIVDGDVRDGPLVATVLHDTAVDTVIHLAAQTLVGPAVGDPVNTFSNNVEGTWTVLEACRGATSVTSIVAASSDKAYGDWSGRPYREDMALRGRHPYDASKAAGDLISQSYAATYQLPVAITRCGNLYGGGDLNWSRVVPGTIRSVLEGSPPVIRSNGMFVRDYLHVSDASLGVLALAREARRRPEIRGEAFNFAAGVRATVLQVVGTILTLMHAPLDPIVLNEELHEIPDQRVSYARARRMLGWHPRQTLDTGLREAIGWYQDNLRLVA